MKAPPPEGRDRRGRASTPSGCPAPSASSRHHPAPTATITAMDTEPDETDDAEARLHANPELLARIEDAEAHPERRVPRPTRP